MHLVYIDVLIFTNIFQDFMLLLILKRALHLRASYFRLLAGSFMGGIASLLALIPHIHFIINLFINIAVALLLILITFGFYNWKTYIKNTATLFIISYLVNGALICFYLAIKPKGMAIINNTVYFDISPLLLIILTLIIYFILRIYKRLFKNHSRAYSMVNVSFSYKNREYCVKCKIDSGCNVKEPFSGNYVIIIDEKSINNTVIDNEKMRIIPFDSLGGKGVIYGFKADEVKIANKIINQDIYIGLCKDIFKNNFNGLVPKNLIED